MLLYIYKEREIHIKNERGKKMILDLRKKEDRLLLINENEKKGLEWRKNLRRVENFKKFHPQASGKDKIIKIEYILFVDNLELGKYNSLNEVINAYESFKENNKIVADNSFFKRVVTFENKEYNCFFIHRDLTVNLSARDTIFEKCVLNRYLY